MTILWFTMYFCYIDVFPHIVVTQWIIGIQALLNKAVMDVMCVSRF